MKRATRCARMVSSRLKVPRRLVSNTGCGAKMLRSTCDSAAKCTTASGFTVVEDAAQSFEIADIGLEEAVARILGH